jgi:hypothetical protein
MRVLGPVSAFRSATLAVSVVVGLGITAHAVSAQNVFERAKRAAEEAARKAREGQQPKAPPQTRQTAQANTAAAPEAASGDCCSPDALRKIASSAGFLDIVGIKLGMTPEQAFAAVKAFNGQLKIDIVNARMEDPAGPPGNFTRVPQYAVAHTVGVPRPPYPTPFVLADGSSDVIVIEFTIPPNRPLVARIVREVTFPTGQLVVASNLLDALRKKYGQESLQGQYSSWVFDSEGKPVSRRLQGEAARCVPVGPYTGFGWSGGGQMPNHNDMDRDTPTQLNLPQLSYDDPERSPACGGFGGFVVGYPLGQSTPPTQQLRSMTVTVQSPGLLYGTRKATHDWLKAKGDAKTKQQEDAAKARSAPKL